MELLDPELSPGVAGNFPKRVFATTKGLSKSDEEVVTGQLSDMFDRPTLSELPGPSVYLNNGTCRELFEAYWRSITV